MATGPITRRRSPRRTARSPARVCDPGFTASRNQNIYTSRITGGLLVGSPGNTKPLSPTLQRAFVVFAQNTSSTIKTFRMTIAAQPVGGHASFSQFTPPTAPLTSIDVSTAPRSMAARSVYATSSNPKTQIVVNVQEIAAIGGAPAPAGLTGAIVLNPDIQNPDIQNPDIQNNGVVNPDIQNAEVYNPDIQNPDIQNPDIQNPDIQNPDIQNPDIQNVVLANPDIQNALVQNPDIQNPDIQNPDIQNPDIQNPDIQNGALTDVTWTMTNTGNTTTAYNVNLFLTSAQVPPGFKFQLILHKTYTTPVALGCDLKTQTQNVVVANIRNPQFADASTTQLLDQNDPRITNPTLWLSPGEIGKITLRIIDPDRSNNVTTADGVLDRSGVQSAGDGRHTDSRRAAGRHDRSRPRSDPPADRDAEQLVAAVPHAAVERLCRAGDQSRSPGAGARYDRRRDPGRAGLACARQQSGRRRADRRRHRAEQRQRHRVVRRVDARQGRHRLHTDCDGRTTRLAAEHVVAVHHQGRRRAGERRGRQHREHQFPRRRRSRRRHRAGQHGRVRSRGTVGDGQRAGTWWLGAPTVPTATVGSAVLNSCVPGGAGFALFGRIGPDGPWQFIGEGPTSLTATTHGFLELAMNDDFYGDNGGNITATIIPPASNPALVVTNTDDSGAGSLRAAITAANAAATPQGIAFNIPGGVPTIALTSPLPAVTQTTVIDGSTQPSYAGTPIIMLKATRCRWDPPLSRSEQLRHRAWSAA